MTTSPSPLPSPHPDARESLQALRRLAPECEPPAHPSALLAFADEEFLLSPATRGIRLQLELLKADLQLAAHGVQSTIAVFGSARCLSRETAEQQKRAACSPQEERQAEQALRQSVHYETARRFAQLVGEYNLTRSNAAERLFICTGGGPGIMEAANRGAAEAGDTSIGLNVVLPREQGMNAYVAPHLRFQFHYFAIRKMHFLLRARAIVAFPGGFGTLDEVLEMLTLMQTGKAQRMPVILFCPPWWRSVVNFERLAADGLIDEGDLSLLSYANSAEEGWALLQRGLRQ